MNKPSMRQFVLVEDGVPILQDDEIINYTVDDVEVATSSEHILGQSKLFITSKRIILYNGSNITLDIDVPFVGLHAICRDTDSYPRPCLYCQLDQEEEDGPDELFLAPSDESQLKEIFDEFCNAAALNPDELEPGEEEGDDELIYNIDEVELGASQAAALAHFESVFVSPESQFEDHEDNA